MSTRKLGISLGAAVLLLGMPTSYALAGQGEGKPDKAPHQCEDGVDNDNDGSADFGADTDCGSARDNSEGPDEDETEEPGTGTPELPALPPELQAVVDQVTGALTGGGEDPGEEEPPTDEEPGEGDPPAGPPALPVDPTTLPGEIQGAVEALLEQLPPTDPAAVQSAIEEAVGQLPPPPA